MKPYLANGSSSAAILWDVENLGYLTAWTGAQLAEGKPFAATNRRQPGPVGVTYDAGDQDPAPRPAAGDHQGQRRETSSS